MASGKDIAGMIDKEIARALRPFTDAELTVIGDAGITTIVDRTKMGVDVNHVRFEQYSDGYKKERERIGRSSATVDLAVTGHMQQAMHAEPRDGEVAIVFLNANEEKKALIHNSGVDKSVSVRSHRRSVAVNAKTGKRVSHKEVALDKKRKNKRVAQRVEAVDTFKRHQRTPKREWFGISHVRDEAAVADVAAGILRDRAK